MDFLPGLRRFAFVFLALGSLWVADPGLALINVGALDTPAFAVDVEVVGGLAYVADGFSNLRVIDVSNPAAPFERGALDTPAFAVDVEVVGGLAYVAHDAFGLRVIDVSNPAVPFERGALDTPGFANDVAVVGTLAHVADGRSGLRVIDFGPEYAPRPDADGDGWPDGQDNCTVVANPDQRDIDEGLDDDSSRPGLQRYGDACDVDLDNDGVVGASDFFSTFRPCLGRMPVLLPACARADLDGDGVVGASDFFGFLRPMLGRAPGPGASDG